MVISNCVRPLDITTVSDIPVGTGLKHLGRKFCMSCNAVSKYFPTKFEVLSNIACEKESDIPTFSCVANCQDCTMVSHERWVCN
jgi:hypothetical protein